MKIEEYHNLTLEDTFKIFIISYEMHKLTEWIHGIVINHNFCSRTIIDWLKQTGFHQCFICAKLKYSLFNNVDMFFDKANLHKV